MSEFLTPKTDAERQEVTRAVCLERRAVENDERIEQLTERERLLIEHTWSAATNHAKTGLSERLASPLAVTLDAAEVRSRLDRWSSRLDTSLAFKRQILGAHHDPRLVSIVAGVDHLLEQMRRARESS